MGKVTSFLPLHLSFKILNDGISLNSPNIHLFISSPLIEDFIKNFVIGTFERQQIVLVTRNYSINLSIITAELLPSILYTEKMKFKLLSPLVLSTRKERMGSLQQYFLRPDDTDDINRVITNNSRNKYNLIYSEENKSDLALTWDESYLRRNKRVTKKLPLMKTELIQLM
jgi:CRISPR-associated endoribonuclease Cas6